MTGNVIFCNVTPEKLFLSNLSRHYKKLPPCTGQTLSTWALLQDAGATTQLNRASAGDKHQEELTVR